MSFAKTMTMGELKAQGISDERWKIQDKLLMYKGLIKIYNREQKNQVRDTNVLKKKNYRKIESLKKEVQELRETLTTSLYGDKRRMRTNLQSNRTIQLAYRECVPDKVIEELNHKNFCLKKQINIIRYKTKTGEKKLLESQVLLGDLKDQISRPDFGRPDLMQQNMTNQIQNYIVKHCAANSIQLVYTRMLQVLRKDERYYEAILVTLQRESDVQAKCLIRGTEMGQLVTEEWANMKAEYIFLEKEVKANMLERERALKEIRDRIAELREESLGFVRTESEIDLALAAEGEVKVKGRTLEDEVAALQKTIDRMLEVTLVPTYEEIFPRMLEQLRQKKRLMEELEYNSSKCEDYLNKKNHAELMFFTLNHSGAEAASRYRTTRDEIKSKIQGQEERLQTILKDQDVVALQILRLRLAIQRLCSALIEIKIPEDYEDGPMPEDEDAIIPPINEDARRLLTLLDSKIKYVRRGLKEKGEIEEQERAFRARFKYMNDVMAVVHYSTPTEEEEAGFVLEVEVEDPQVPNRLAVKEASAEIYELATRNPYEVVEEKKPKKKKQ